MKLTNIVTLKTVNILSTLLAVVVLTGSSRLVLAQVIDCGDTTGDCPCFTADQVTKYMVDDAGDPLGGADCSYGQLGILLSILDAKLTDQCAAEFQSFRYTSPRQPTGFCIGFGQIFDPNTGGCDTDAKDLLIKECFYSTKPRTARAQHKACEANIKEYQRQKGHRCKRLIIGNRPLR